MLADNPHLLEKSYLKAYLRKTVIEVADLFYFKALYNFLKL